MKICTRKTALRRLLHEIFQDLSVRTVESRARLLLWAKELYDGKAAPGVK